jgi:ubiquilin
MGSEMHSLWIPTWVAKFSRLLAGGMPGMGGMGGLFGGLGAGSAAPGTGANSGAPPEERFREQLTALRDMGFSDQDSNIRALTATGGNVEAAVDRLLSGGFL